MSDISKFGVSVPFSALFAIPAFDTIVILECACNLAPLGRLLALVHAFEVIVLLKGPGTSIVHFAKKKKI